MAPFGITLNVPAHPQRRKTRPRPLLKASVDDLEKWFAAAPPGDAREYHRGLLAIDRSIGSRPGRDEWKEFGRIADVMMAWAKAGHVHLVQRRHAPGDYSYIAVVRRSSRRCPLQAPGAAS